MPQSVRKVLLLESASDSQNMMKPVHNRENGTTLQSSEWKIFLGFGIPAQ